MRLHHLFEANVEPDWDLINNILEAVDSASHMYQQHLDANNDEDDIEYLVELLNDEAEEYDVPVNYFVINQPNNNPINGDAGIYDGEVLVQVYVNEAKMVGKWGPKWFRDLMTILLKHETIHLNQFKKIGHDKMANMKSGHQKGMELKAKGGSEEDWAKAYHDDKHEVMAYANDLADEIRDTAEHFNKDRFDVLRGIRQWAHDLPTYAKYVKLFGADAPQVKLLLKYASGYLK